MLWLLNKTKTYKYLRVINRKKSILNLCTYQFTVMVLAIATVFDVVQIVAGLFAQKT